MRIFVKDILELIGSDVIRVLGQYGKVYIDNLADVKNVNKTTLDWINPTKPNKQEIAERSFAKTLLVDNSILYSPIIKSQDKVLIVVKNPKRALAEVGNHYFVLKSKPEIHPTAIIDDDAIIGDNACIGPYTVIGKANIGNDCIIDGNVRIYDGVSIGNSCNIKSGAVLGGAGFGFEKDAQGNRFRFPQIGKLIIGDDVEIGANTCIDRGALSDTVIGNHTKINNLCHIAHNNKIGNNVIITGCVNVSGSNIIDDDVWIAPNSSIRGFVHLEKGCIIGMGAVVTKNVPAGETWVGNPAHKLSK